MKIDILSLFPEMIKGIVNESILKRAQEKEIVDVNIINFREFSRNKHKAVDDYSYGGGAGMVLKPEPLFEAVESIKKDKDSRIILLSPQGTVFSQTKAEELSKLDHIIMICGHYEGFDERIRQTLVDEEISIGDYVLTGGELGALVITDAVVRLLPGALGKEDSHQNDSFSTGLLEYPQYTRPADFRGLKVPDVLLSGNHMLIEKWRRKESLRRTYIRRPDLLDEINLSDEDKKMLEAIKEEVSSGE